jgi:hypothetical protein
MRCIRLDSNYLILKDKRNKNPFWTQKMFMSIKTKYEHFEIVTNLTSILVGFLLL